jgi:ABC-type branched-subunit amino acid transport system permease subunit
VNALASGGFWAFVGVVAGIYTILSLGLQLQFGFAGLLNFGQVAFMAIGAYTMAILVVKEGWSTWLAAPLGVVAAGAAGLLLVTQSKGNLPLTIFGFMMAYAGFKAYLPAFWSLPSLFLSGTSAAGSIGFINSVGNLGGFMGPFVLGTVEKLTGSFMGGLFFLATCMALSSLTVFLLGRSEPGETDRTLDDTLTHPPLVKRAKVGAETTP